MKKTNKYLLLLLLLVFVAGGLYFMSGNENNTATSSQEFEGVMGTISDISMSARVVTIEMESGDTFNLALTNNSDVFDLHNREVTLQDIERGQTVRASGDQTDDTSMIITEIHVVDTESLNEITVYDNGKTFTFTPTSQFSVVLNDNQYPFGNLACSPSGVVSNISNGPGANPPFYSARYEAVSVGSCELTNNDFSVTIIVEDNE